MGSAGYEPLDQDAATTFDQRQGRGRAHRGQQRADY